MGGPSSAELEAIAARASITLSPEECVAFARELEQILAWASALNDTSMPESTGAVVDTSLDRGAHEPTSSDVQPALRRRADRPRAEVTAGREVLVPSVLD